MASRGLKRSAFRALRAMGAYSLAERLSSHGLKILCYHGISVVDEHGFKPGLFMRNEIFAARMDWLASNGYQVLALGDAVERLNLGTLPRRAVVITFDDGWVGCLDGAFRKLVSVCDYQHLKKDWSSAEAFVWLLCV